MQFRDFLKIWLISWIPDLALSWTYMRFSDSQTSSFWWCLLTLQGIQIFFMIKTIIAGSLIFHLFSKERVSEVMVTSMRRAKYPPPEIDEDFESYMYRLVTDESFSTEVRIAANGSLCEFRAVQQTGLFVSLRAAATADLAMKKYIESN